MAAPTVRLARPDELAAIADVLTAAFHDDPVWRYLVPTDAQWRSVPYVFRHAVHHHLGRSVWVSDERQAVAVWSAPGFRVSTWRDLPAAPRSAAVFRRRSLDGLRFQSAMRKHRPTEPHWYLGILGTHPDHQGRGFGSAVLLPGLARCDAEGISAYLESSKEANIPFYERHGFRVLDELRPVPAAPPIWKMSRDPQPPTERP
jgi:ribosomal protein S18 acetylase RimI-like enzyme